MPVIEFRHQDSALLLSRVKDCSIIPAAGDCIYAPSDADTGTYFHCRVTLREFYYDQHGYVAMVKLVCRETPS